MIVKTWLKYVGISILSIALIGAGVGYYYAEKSKFPASMNMGMNMSMNNQGKTVSVTQLVQAPTAAPVTTYTLVAENKTLQIGGHTIHALTYNGTAPGPTLVVTQGDRLVVHLVNHANVGVTIHWHGVDVPNANDGVAGVTQNAVAPGGQFTYSFVVNQSGTFWYHSHQESGKETDEGLYGVLIVKPKHPTTEYVNDDVVTLHNWGSSLFTLNDSTGQTRFKALPGQLVRVRIVNTDNKTHNFALVGSSFQVEAIDGHAINRPTDLTNCVVPIAASQRYDLTFRVPATGAVKLVGVDSDIQQLSSIFGTGDVAVNFSSLQKLPLFDYSNYGSPVPSDNTLTLQTKYDVVYNMSLGMSLGFFNGHPDMTFTINGKTFENIMPIMVKSGDLVKIHMVNNSPTDHPMHLHGHSLRVLDVDGKPLQGSPIYLNTVLVRPHQSCDVAFVANNPGLWMVHCHNLDHAENGMDMMVDYAGVTTPFTVGSQSGNFPD